MDLEEKMMLKLPWVHLWNERCRNLVYLDFSSASSSDKADMGRQHLYLKYDIL
jgi:hypothetical protein